MEDEEWSALLGSPSTGLLLMKLGSGGLGFRERNVRLQGFGLSCWSAEHLQDFSGDPLCAEYCLRFSIFRTSCRCSERKP